MIVKAEFVAGQQRENDMYTAVQVDASREVKKSLPGTFDTPRACLEAARKAFGKSGALQFVKNPKLICM